MLADDDNVFLVIKAGSKRVCYFKYNKEGQHRVKHGFDAEGNGTAEHNENVKNKIGCALADAVIFVNNAADDIHTAGAAAYAVNYAHADAVHNAAGNAAEHFFRYVRRISR